MEIKTSVFNDLMWCSMRYALGRKTYIVGRICDVLIEYVDDLFPCQRKAMAEEIAEAIDSGQAGMNIDVKEWKKVLGALKNE